MGAKQNKFIIILLIFLIAIAVGLTIFLYSIFTSEGGHCLTDPMGYAQEKLTKTNNVSIICECKEGFEWEVDLTNLKNFNTPGEIEWKEE